MITPEEDRRWWIKLQTLYDNEDIKGFYSLYSKYLEAAGIVSTSRIILHKMAKLVSESK